MENQIIERIPIHHALTMITHGSMGGARDPLVNVANKFVLHGGQ